MKLLISSDDLSSLHVGGESLHFSYELRKPGWYKLSSMNHPDTNRPTHVVLLKVDNVCSDINSLDADPDIIVMVKVDSQSCGAFKIQSVFTCGLEGHLTVMLYTSTQIGKSVFHKLYEQDPNSYNLLPLIGSAYPCNSSPHWYAWGFHLLHKVNRYLTVISQKKFLNKLYCFGEINDRQMALDQLVMQDGNQQENMCVCAMRLRFQVYALQLLINGVLGLLALSVVFFYGPIVSGVVRSHTESAVQAMLALLDWMMGVPAGLKLNYRLTICLGKFFSYHVYVWAGYLGVVSTYFELMMKAIVSVGAAGGLTLQVALLQDLIDLLTLHLFCFYIYSCRLYSLVAHTLLSLSRLLRGLKWNSLRQRVDHASYDVTQLLIGTLIFSILLFLLPTVFLYYSVFTMFRLVVMTSQICLAYLRLSLNYNFILIRLLASFNSACLNCDIHLTLNTTSNDELTILDIDKVTAAQYSRCLVTLRLPTPNSHSNHGTSSIEGTFIRKLTNGTIL